MKAGIEHGLCCAAVIIALLGGLVAIPAHASYESVLIVDGRPLELACLSEEPHWRDRCVDHIQTLLDEDRKDLARGREGAVIDCYFGELLILKNVGLRSYREILEGIEWLETADGKARTASYPEIAKVTREFAEKIEPARDAIQKVRDTGWLQWPCYASPFMWKYFW